MYSPLPTSTDNQSRHARAWRVVAVLAGVLLAGAVHVLLVSHGDFSAAAAPAEFYGAWVLTPALVTILLALVLRQVVPALAIGILVAACMLVPLRPADAPDAAGFFGAVQLAVGHYLIDAVAHADHMKIVVFTLLISAMVGVIGAAGGTAAVVNAVARWGTTRRRGQVSTWLAGLLVFFDDYANAMIVGPSMRPVCDRLRISRAKLAYIVDSTAAPVASIALIGTWIGYEIGLIQDGLDQLAARPEFLTDVNGYGAFFSSIPYRFYAILALFMVLLVALLGRDFGPMRKAEQQVADRPEIDPATDAPAGAGRAWYAIVPVLALVGITITLLILPGWRSIDWATFQPPPGSAYSLAVLQRIMAEADPFAPILYASWAALVLSILIAVGTGTLTLRAAMDAAQDSMGRLLPTIVVLTLAWTLSASMQDLQLGEVAVEHLRGAGFDQPGWQRALPLCVFVSACIVSFATGTSWGTMGILCPAVVTIAAGLLAGQPADAAAPVFYAAVGAVLAGAVFGDHCSPISDTTVLSSLATACPLETHVWTQMPYALTVALVGILCGDGLCTFLGLPVWVGLLVGMGVLTAWLWVVGRPPIRSAN